MLPAEPLLKRQVHLEDVGERQASWPERTGWILLALAAHALLFGVIVNFPQGAPTLPPQPLMVSLLLPVAQSLQPPAPLQAPRPVPDRAETRATAATAASARENIADALAAAPLTVTASTLPPPVETAPPPAVTLPRFDAAYLNNPRPAYPVFSKRLKEQGRVQLRVHVLTTGLPDQIEVFKSSGFPRLDNAARDAVQSWRFDAARRGSESIAEWVVVPLDFVLEK